MLKGVSDPLNSAFHLSYNMLLNSMRIEDTDPEFIIRRSLHQF
jgi:ATP-dependent RNA helicase DOB1